MLVSKQSRINLQPSSVMSGVTHCDVVKQSEGGGAAAGTGGDAVQVLSDGSGLPLAAAVRSRRHHLSVPVLQVHRPLHAVPGNRGVVRKDYITLSPVTGRRGSSGFTPR